MDINKENAQIIGHKYEHRFTYDNNVMLTLTVENFSVFLKYNKRAENIINNRINMQSTEFFKYASSVLYKQAVREYRNAKQNGYPFRPFDAVLHYEVTYNSDCHLSFYRDRYEYLGGAHGTTVRRSDTYNLVSGGLVPLSAYFTPDRNYTEYLLNYILKEADRKYAEEGIYFDDYRAMIRKNFNPENYYLVDNGLAEYFLQYEIAPYAAGIIVFTIPYSMLDYPPSCL